VSQQPQPIATITEPQAGVVSIDFLDALAFPGLEIRSVVANTVRLMRLTIEEGTKTVHHNHADEELFLLLEGRARALGGDEVFTLSPGDVFMVPPFVPHQIEALANSVLIEVGGPGPIMGRLRRP
jgi:quercetin dioxygenase-like cupin family protein